MVIPSKGTTAITDKSIYIRSKLYYNMFDVNQHRFLFQQDKLLGVFKFFGGKFKKKSICTTTISKYATF